MVQRFFQSSILFILESALIWKKDTYDIRSYPPEFDVTLPYGILGIG